MIHVLDAFCPHLGANLGVGGKVVGDCIECPFHGWQYSGDTGKCTNIPYSKTIPEVAKTRSWPVRELNDCIFLWHDVDANPPTYELPAFKHFQRMRNHGCIEHLVPCHCQEGPENGTDFQHFHFLHSDFVTKWLWFVKHKWSASWEQAKPPNQHMADMVIRTEFTFFGYRIPKLEFISKITQIGPGCVHLEFDIGLGSRVVFNETVTPIAPLLQRVHHVCWADWWVPRFIPKIMLKMLIMQYERDVPIWSNKAYLRKPMIQKEDGQVAKFRRYYSQFYSKQGTKRREGIDW